MNVKALIKLNCACSCAWSLLSWRMSWNNINALLDFVKYDIVRGFWKILRIVFWKCADRNSAAISARGTQTKLFCLERTLALLFYSVEMSREHAVYKDKEKCQKILAFFGCIRLYHIIYRLVYYYVYYMRVWMGLTDYGHLPEFLLTKYPKWWKNDDSAFCSNWLLTACNISHWQLTTGLNFSWQLTPKDPH